ncbi:MAG: STAS domain-containing protein [Mariprofundaceae bacterium]|nr:STAS domain-containing protein [Mariprofundaceae bacterium]
MIKNLEIVADNFQLQDADKWVKLSLKGALLLVEFKHHTLDASFGLQVYQESLLLKHIKKRSRLAIDLKHVSVANSSGLALLVQLFQAMPAGSRLYILHANAEISELLHDTFLDQLFPMFDHIHELPVEATGLRG